MERLTFVDEDGQVLFDNPAGFPEDVGFTIRELAENEEWETLDDIAQRLANYEQRLKEYEDIGLTPVQLREIDKLYAEKCKELAELEKAPTAYDVHEVVERLESMQDITGWDLLTVQECLKIVKSGGIG